MVSKPLLFPALALALAWLPAPLLCQTPHYIYSPSGLEKKEGPAGDDYPFAVPVIRYQQVHDDLTRRALLEGMAFRRDGLRTIPMKAWSVEMEAWMTTAKVQARTMTTTFAANRGNDFTQVLPRSWIHFPDLPRPSAPPAPFTAVVPFKQAFPFKAEGSLLWEVAIHGNKQGNLSNSRVFNYLDAQAPTLAKGPHTAFGKGCKSSQGKIPSLDGWLRSDGFFRAALTGAPAFEPGLAFFGRNDKKFFTYTLPLDLGPMGAPGCKLLTDILSFTPFTTDAMGNGLLQAGKVPITAEMEGRAILLQALLLDRGANALGVVLSNGVKIVAPKAQGNTGVSRLYSLGDLKASQGLRDFGYGLVTRFRAR